LKDVVDKEEEFLFEKKNYHMQGFSILVSKVGLVVSDVSIEDKALEESNVVVGIAW
jgi:hypothetical protein